MSDTDGHLQVLRPTIVFHGPAAEHDMPCACCGHRKAVYNLNEAVFKPCWICQETWELRRIPWYRGILSRRKD